MIVYHFAHFVCLYILYAFEKRKKLLPQKRHQRGCQKPLRPGGRPCPRFLTKQREIQLKQTELPRQKRSDERKKSPMLKNY